MSESWSQDRPEEEEEEEEDKITVFIPDSDGRSSDAGILNG